MTGWLIFAAYVAGWVIASRKIAVAMTADEEKTRGKAGGSTDRVMNRAVGCMIGLFWPLILLGALITGRLPKTTLQQRAERDRLAREIAELEAESERLRREIEAA